MLRNFILWYSELKLLDRLAVSMFIGLAITAVVALASVTTIVPGR